MLTFGTNNSLLLISACILFLTACGAPKGPYYYLTITSPQEVALDIKINGVKVSKDTPIGPNFSTPFLIDSNIIKTSNTLEIKVLGQYQSPLVIDGILESFEDKGYYVPYEGEEVKITLAGPDTAAKHFTETGEIVFN